MAFRSLVGHDLADESRFVMVENADGTITVTSEEVFAAAELNVQLAKLEIRAKAIRADPSCGSTVAEVEWAELFPRIVIQSHSAPDVRIQPDAIPLRHTLVLAAERAARPGRQPGIVVRTMLVTGPAPDCVCAFLTPASPIARFDAPAREVVAQARQEAIELQQLNVGPEHILLAILRRHDDVAGQALNSLDVTFERVRAQIAQSIAAAQPLAHRPTAGAPPFTPRATDVLHHARAEADRLGNDLVAPEHILLGLLDDRESSVVRLLRESGADAEQIRTTVTRLLNPAEPDSDPANG